MGMFDRYYPKKKYTCPECNAPIKEEWQSKVGDCSFISFKEGDELGLDNDGHKYFIREDAIIHNICDQCDSFIKAKIICDDSGKWVDTSDILECEPKPLTVFPKDEIEEPDITQPEEVSANEEVGAFENDDYIVADGYNDAIIGLTTEDIVVYDIDKMVKIIVNRDNVTEEEAYAYLEFKLFPSKVGARTPIYVNLNTDFLKETE